MHHNAIQQFASGAPLHLISLVVFILLRITNAYIRITVKLWIM